MIFWRGRSVAILIFLNHETARPVLNGLGSLTKGGEVVIRNPVTPLRFGNAALLVECMGFVQAISRIPY